MRVTGTEARNRFGSLCSQAKREPVFVEKAGQHDIVFLSAEQYLALQAGQCITSHGLLVAQMHRTRENAGQIIFNVTRPHAGTLHGQKISHAAQPSRKSVLGLRPLLRCQRHALWQRVRPHAPPKRAVRRRLAGVGR